MKNIIKTTAIFIFLMLIFNIKSFAQPVLDNPQGETTVDCKTQIIDPEIEYTYPPDDPGDGGGDEDDDDRDDDYEYKEKRRVMFVHGYKGNDASWSKAQTYLDNIHKEDVLIFNETYQTSGMTSLDEIATQIKSKNLNNIPSTNPKENYRNFFIAHSMGGMALRFMQNKYSPGTRPYGGIITVGSAHQGIYAAETKKFREKKYKDFLIESCAVNVEPKIIEKLPVIANKLNSIFGIISLSYLSESVCKGTVNYANEFLMDEDIDPALTITALQATYPQTLEVENKLALYGVEEDEGEFIVSQKVKSSYGTEHQLTVTVDGLVLPKFLGSVVNPPSKYENWGDAGESDYEGLSFWSESILSYTANRDYSAQYALNFWNQFLRPNETEKHVLLRNAYDRALRWMRDANFQYNELIGGYQNITVSSNYCRCKMESIPNHYFSQNYLYSGNCDDLVGTYIGGYLVSESYRLAAISVEKFDTDGFVVANSAKAMPGADRSIKMQGSGHFQMRNDINLRKEFDRMFKLSVYGEYYKL